MPRIFIALPLPDDIRRELSAQGLALKVKNPALRVVGPEAMHLTIRFIGAVPDETVVRLAAILDDVAAGIAPLRFSLKNLGCFPSVRRARVVWSGLGGDLERLEQLARDVDAGCGRLGLPPEGRPFKGHITLGRLKTPSVVDIDEDQAVLAFDVNEIILFGSELRKEGARYTVLHRSFLGIKGE